MMDWIICVLTNFFRIYLIRKFIHVLLGDAVQEKRKEVFAYGAFFMVNTGLYIAFHLVWVNILSNLLGISLMVLLYTKSVKTNLFVTSSIYLVNIGCDAIAVLLFADYTDGQGFNQICVVATIFLIFICELLTEKIINHRKNNGAIQNLPLIAVPLCSMLIVLYEIKQRQDPDEGLVIISMGLLVINFLVFYLYNMLLKSFTQKYENDMLRQKIQIYSRQINTILQSNETVNALRHDMKHHMNEMKLLAKKNDPAAMEKYIDSMEEFINNPNEIVSSGNIAIDSVLNYMLEKARQELHSVNVNVQIPKAISHSFDINIILGNLLENAIDAAMKTEEKLLNINIRLKQGVLRIEIANSYNGELFLRTNEGKEDTYLTTKQGGKGQHGIGLGSVRRMIEKYNGIMEIFHKDNMFRVKLMLYMVVTEH